MIQAATAQIPLVEGRLDQRGDQFIVLALPITEYRLRLALPPARGTIAPGPGATQAPSAPGLPATAKPGDRVRGVIRVRASRVDVVQAGGRYIEPIYGRPRRIQGMVAANDGPGNTLTVACAPGCTVVAELTANQRASDFTVGSLVTFGVEKGAEWLTE